MSATVSAAALAASSSLAAALADPSAGAALAAVEGLGLGAGLIIAIGAQNAYVLRQGLRRQHVFAVATVCFLIDCMLIALGAGGFASLLRAVPSLPSLAAWGGALRSEEHTSELQSLMRTSYAVFCLKKNKNKRHIRVNSAIATSPTRKTPVHS